MMEHQDPASSLYSWVMRRVGVRCRQCSHDKNTMVVVIMVTELERRKEGSERWGRCGGNLRKTKFLNSFTSMWCDVDVNQISQTRIEKNPISAMSALGDRHPTIYPAHDPGRR